MSRSNQPVDPTKQKRVLAGLYGVQASPVDDTIWGQSMDVGFSRMDQPSYLVHFIPGADPTHTGLTEIFQPPEGAFGTRGMDVDSKGVVWTAMSSGHLASFDRSKCKAPLTGPNAATGKQCAEGWTLYRFPGPQFAGVDEQGSANHAYYVWVDRYNTFGLGENVPMAMTNGGEAITALVDGKFLQFHVPYPAGYLHQERRWPDRRRECRLEGARAVDHVGHADDVPQRDRQGREPAGLPHPASARSAGALNRAGRSPAGTQVEALLGCSKSTGFGVVRRRSRALASVVVRKRRTSVPGIGRPNRKPWISPTPFLSSVAVGLSVSDALGCDRQVQATA